MSLAGSRVEAKTRAPPERLPDEQHVLMPLTVVADREANGASGLEDFAVKQLAVRLMM
jgi:hypothetical protein